MDIFSAMDPPVDSKRILVNKIILKISKGSKHIRRLHALKRSEPPELFVKCN